jgi:hypothetical protein
MREPETDRLKRQLLPIAKHCWNLLAIAFRTTGPVRGNLANTLSNLGERESGTDHLEEAVMVYYDSLKELTRERAPYLWARTVGKESQWRCWLSGAKTLKRQKLP